jgi:hypothetical protein
MAYDSIRQEVVMFGGKLASRAASSQTWTWNGANWRLRTPAVVPPARDVPTAAFDPVRGVVVIFGGVNPVNPPQINAETWLWDGTNWTQYVAQPPAVPTRLPDQVVTVGQTARLTAHATGDAPLSYQWSFNGAPLDGANTETLTLASVGCSQAGAYSVIVSNSLGSASSSANLSVLGMAMYAGLTLCGNPGRTYRIEWTSALGSGNDWQTAATITLGSSPYVWVDLDSANQPRRFYRAIQVP